MLLMNEKTSFVLAPARAPQPSIHRQFLSEKIPLRTLRSGKPPDQINKPPFGKRGSFVAIFVKPGYFGEPKIHGIQEKRYSEEISKPVSCPDPVFHDVEKNPG
jgi:hypothetical protein